MGPAAGSGYPTDLFYVERPDGQLRFSACNVFKTEVGLLSVDATEGALIKKAAETLNALSKRKAAEFGWHFVEIAPDFAGHGYCRDDAERMWIRAEESCRNDGDFDGSMHPNYRGHTVTAQRYREQLLNHTATAWSGSTCETHLRNSEFHLTAVRRLQARRDGVGSALTPFTCGRNL